ncbi:hypothetical protein SORBI_3006G252532 [Sorghum bicolor]|uniref:Uncharacterized protein n=1 Tax=Sorghum bicolor TaxID=4558 RepID=A0A1Z5RFF3_SORBI|nr:hypothetical protein SORBI_3006G252532 [Sorghum bicolor]
MQKLAFCKGLGVCPHSIIIIISSPQQHSRRAAKYSRRSPHSISSSSSSTQQACREIFPAILESYETGKDCAARARKIRAEIGRTRQAKIRAHARPGGLPALLRTAPGHMHHQPTSTRHRHLIADRSSSPIRIQRSEAPRLASRHRR